MQSPVAPFGKSFNALACDDIEVILELTEALKRLVNIVPAKEAHLDGTTDEIVDKLKPEFEKYFGDETHENTQ